MSGTSMSSPTDPVLAVQNRFRSLLGSLPRSSLVRAAIIASATPATRMVFYTPGDTSATTDADNPNTGCAYGAVNVSALLYTSDWMYGSVEADTIPANSVAEECFIAAASQVSVAVSWTEPSAVPGSTSPVV